jgi:hypothetical protein
MRLAFALPGGRVGCLLEQDQGVYFEDLPPNVQEILIELLISGIQNLRQEGEEVGRP